MEMRCPCWSSLWVLRAPCLVGSNSLSPLPPCGLSSLLLSLVFYFRTGSCMSKGSYTPRNACSSLKGKSCVDSSWTCSASENAGVRCWTGPQGNSREQLRKKSLPSGSFRLVQTHALVLLVQMLTRRQNREGCEGCACTRGSWADCTANETSM